MEVLSYELEFREDLNVSNMQICAINVDILVLDQASRDAHFDVTIIDDRIKIEPQTKGVKYIVLPLSVLAIIDQKTTIMEKIIFPSVENEIISRYDSSIIPRDESFCKTTGYQVESRNTK